MSYYKSDPNTLNKVRRARRDTHCDGAPQNPACTSWIRKGERYTYSALPPGGEMGGLGWSHVRLCATCLDIGAAA